MRDINRIDDFCNRLAAVWKENCPDWRFGQFMMNVLNSFDKDPWFMEEYEMIERIENFFGGAPETEKE